MSKSGADFEEVDKELEDILENEVKYDSDGVARGHSPGRPPSANSSAGSVGSRDSRGKRRTWKKPKDKPKRPLSAYNIFFKHERSRIVEGRDEDASPDEVIRSIENILSTSRETRRHRKTHGRISFGDLARKIAEKWKAIVPEHKAVFEHYAELDMRRYRKEVKIWKDKKDNEALAGKGSAHESINNNSISSLDSESEFSLEHITSQSTNDAWAPRKNFYDSMNSSFSSSCSVDSELSLEPIPIGDMLKKARPNFHNSMPSLETGVPGVIQGDFQTSASIDMPLMNQFGNQSLSSMPFSGQVGSMNNNSNHNNNNNNVESLTPQQIIQQQQELIRRQQQMLEQQRESLQMQQQRQQMQMQMQQLQQQQQQQQQQQGYNNSNNNHMNFTNNINVNNMNAFAQHQQQQQQQQFFQPNEALSSNVNVIGRGNGNSGTGGGTELDGFLSNLDLSNV
eukprot:CAMPEP_0117069038 /NCGR_PEP_ID=MMETSP0472-20121206/48386_1 /TAXON_ID=693140 ORGANISM="Tiarina fusus, Strain LIS" /NCGR_SAMPLE_ID=MMETSP0472 /ASSEMBLY_ACC=CAM_ASM_000603 /LENGTH=451 /DNA_ID=CAMNT_0004791343 /DNA_START=162 /DNA_END=1517 /DNA_ORIENTATION=+